MDNNKKEEILKFLNDQKKSLITDVMWVLVIGFLWIQYPNRTEFAMIAFSVLLISLIFRACKNWYIYAELIDWFKTSSMYLAALMTKKKKED